jgi:carbamoyl-phosphate synthase large subunit
MVCDEKKKLAAIVPVKVRLKKGITILAETDYNPYVIEACLKIHNTIPARGCYNIQLILTKNKKVFPFEINPRISTTFCMTIASGIDPIMIFMKGNNEKNLLKSKSKLKLKRFWKNFIIK